MCNIVSKLPRNRWKVKAHENEIEVELSFAIYYFWTVSYNAAFLFCQVSVQLLTYLLNFVFIILFAPQKERNMIKEVLLSQSMYFFKKIQQMQLFSDKQYCEPSLRPNILNFKKVKSYIHIVLLTKYNHRHKERQLWLDNLYSENDYQYFRNG